MGRKTRPVANRYTLFNNELRTRAADGSVETQVLANGEDLAATLKDRFGLAIAAPDVAVLLR